jgi:GPH family glycoside/pentoside/hexuronide:cation symporter
MDFPSVRANACPTTPSGVLASRERIAYGLGDFASGLYWQTFMVYLTFFYTDVFGLSALAAGTLLASSRSLDALFDPVMGALADRTRTRWGKFRPYLLWLSPPLALAGVLAFTVPDAAAIRVGWAWVTFNLLMLVYTGINIPYTALLAVLTPDPVERTALSSIKFVFAFVAKLVVSVAVLPLSRVLGAGDAALGWQRCFFLIGAVATAAFVITFLETRERVEAPPEQAAHLGHDLRDLSRNGPWLLLVAFNLLSSSSLAVVSSTNLHYFKYYIGAQTLTLPAFLPGIGGTRVWGLEALVAAFSTAGGVASVCGVLLLPAFARVVGRKRAFLLLYGVVLACTLSVYWVRPDQILLLFCLSSCVQFTGAPISALLWAMYADTADYAEWKTARRSTGLLFAIVMFAGKQGWALGALVSLGLMSRFGFVANAEQTTESLRGILLLASVVPAAIGALALLLVAFYPLDDARVLQIGQILSQRRAHRQLEGSA